jgi:hypothetical protein
LEVLVGLQFHVSYSRTGDWPPERRSGALARRGGGKVARIGRLENLRYIAGAYQPSIMVCPLFKELIDLSTVLKSRQKVKEQIFLNAEK